MTKCKKCGAKLTEDDLFCPECGTKVEKERKVKHEHKVKEEHKIHEKKSKGWMWVVVGIIALIVVASIIFIVFSYYSNPCNKPYIKVGKDCCLDSDNNNICDKDENSNTKSEPGKYNVTEGVILKEFALWVASVTEPNSILISNKDEGVLYNTYTGRTFLEHDYAGSDEEIVKFMSVLYTSLHKGIPIYMSETGIGYDPDGKFRKALLENFDIYLVGSKTNKKLFKLREKK